MPGINGADSRNSSPGRRTTPAGLPRRTRPATVSTTPASSGRQRARTARATGSKLMTASSTPIRIRRRIRLARVLGGAPAGPTAPSDWRHTTRLRRCDRSLIAASCTPGSAVRTHNPTLRRSSAAPQRGWIRLGAGMGLPVAGLEALDRHVGVDLSSRGRGMAEDLLDAAQVGAAFEQVGGRAVADTVRAGVPDGPRLAQALVHDPAGRARVQATAPDA